MFLKRGKELFFGSFVVVKTEFILEDPFKLSLCFNKEIVITSNIFLLDRGDLRFPGLEFFFILSNLSLKNSKFLKSVLKTDSELLIDGEDFHTLLGSGIRTLLINVQFETSMVISDFQLVLLHHFELIHKIPHGFSEGILIRDPFAVHLLKGISGDSLLGHSSFKFNLGILFSLKDNSEGRISIFDLRSDRGDFFVPPDLSLLGEDVSTKIVKSPVEVVIEHVKSGFSVGFLKSNVVDSGFSWSGSNFLLDKKLGISSTVEGVLINVSRESSLFMFRN